MSPRRLTRHASTDIKRLISNNQDVWVGSNRVAGGAVWELWFKGEQFIIHHDYGRLCQTALETNGSIDRGMTFDPPPQNPNVPIHPNPTEAGTTYQGEPLGSPTAELNNAGNVQHSLSVPLDFLPRDFGGDKDHPVIWQDVRLGKYAEVDPTIGGFTFVNVVKYTTRVYTPVTLTGQRTRIFFPALYINTTYHHLHHVDPATGNYWSQALPDHITTGDSGETLPAAGMATGSVFGKPNGECIGVYVYNPGNNTGLGQTIFNNATGTGGGAQDDDCYILHTSRVGNIPSGWSTYTAYIVVGDNIAQVANTMHELWSRGAR